MAELKISPQVKILRELSQQGETQIALLAAMTEQHEDMLCKKNEEIGHLKTLISDHKERFTRSEKEKKIMIALNIILIATGAIMASVNPAETGRAFQAIIDMVTL